MGEAVGDYAVLIALSTREEAEVAASALRADGIDAFVGNATHANNDWNMTVALGGLQLLVPRARLADAKDALRERIRTARENQEGEPTSRRDHYKIWLVIAWTLLMPLALIAYATTLSVEELERAQRLAIDRAFEELGAMPGNSR